MEGLKGKRILVTGGTGFIGSHLVEKLLHEGAQVFVPYISINPQSYFVLNNLGSKTTTLEVDITDKDKISQFLLDTQPEYIFHLAAETIVTEAFNKPYETLNVNIMGTVNLLECVRSTPAIKGIIVASSDKAYGKTKEAYTENSPLKGDHPYDVSKSAADLICQAYYKTYGTPVVITRFGNVYGEGDLHFDRIVPGICKAIINEEILEIRSDGTFVRDYLYVKDVVDGYLALLDNINAIHGEAYNFSSTDTLSVLDLIADVEKMQDKKIQYKILNNAKNEIPYQHLNDEKVKKLGWSNHYTFSSTFSSILSWYTKVVQKI